MSRLSLPITGAALAATAAVVLAGYGPPDLSWESLTDCQLRLGREAELSARLEGRTEEVGRRSAVRRQLIEELLDGKRGLFDVAARFEELNAECPSTQTHLETFPGQSHGEQVCRQVLIWAEVVAGERDGELAWQAVARLHRELDEHVQKHGGVDLPAAE